MKLWLWKGDPMSWTFQPATCLWQAPPPPVKIKKTKNTRVVILSSGDWCRKNLTMRREYGILLQLPWVSTTNHLMIQKETAWNSDASLEWIWNGSGNCERGIDGSGCRELSVTNKQNIPQLHFERERVVYSVTNEEIWEHLWSVSEQNLNKTWVTSLGRQQNLNKIGAKFEICMSRDLCTALVSLREHLSKIRVKFE